MDYEKKYKEAIERAIFVKENTDSIGAKDVSDVIEYIFSELKKSEDERIRKEIISALQYANHKGVYDKHLAWLEKQGDIDRRIQEEIEKQTKQQWKAEKQDEQNHADKVEPKFKQGEWIVWKDKNYKVNYNGCGYELFDQNGLSTSWDYKTIEDNAHLWTVQDAKDGDVLLFEGYYNSIVLFQGIGINGKGRINYHCKCDLVDYSFGIQGDVACLGTIEKDAEHYHPATKEQRDLLFQKMKESGYEWDAEKKELKKIHVIDEGKSEMDYCFTKMMNGEKINHAWSEEDEKMIARCIDIFEKILKSSYVYAYTKDCLSWLKSLKDRVQPHWKPSKEQMNALESTLQYSQVSLNSFQYLNSLFNDLKKLEEK